MEHTLKEQLAAAHADVQRCGAEQQKLSAASATINNKIRELSALKEAVASAQEEAAQVSARRLIGEATDEEAADARHAADRAAGDAAGAERLIAQLQREAELIHERYMAAVPPGTAAQNVCNQLRASILLESADEAAVEYLEAVAVARDKLAKLFGHAKAMNRIHGAEPFVRYFHAALELPAFPMLRAFRPNPHNKLTLTVGLGSDVDAAADGIIGKLRDDGYAF